MSAEPDTGSISLFHERMDLTEQGEEDLGEQKNRYLHKSAQRYA